MEQDDSVKDYPEPHTKYKPTAKKGQTEQKRKPADVSTEVNQMLELSERILILKQIPPNVKKCYEFSRNKWKSIKHSVFFLLEKEIRGAREMSLKLENIYLFIYLFAC